MRGFFCAFYLEPAFHQIKTQIKSIYMERYMHIYTQGEQTRPYNFQTPRITFAGRTDRSALRQVFASIQESLSLFPLIFPFLVLSVSHGLCFVVPADCWALAQSECYILRVFNCAEDSFHQRALFRNFRYISAVNALYIYNSRSHNSG